MDFLDAAAAVSAVMAKFPDKVEQAREKPALRSWLVGQALMLTDAGVGVVTMTALVDAAFSKEFTHLEDIAA